MTAAAHANIFLDSALAYAERGWHVLPCKPKAKIPLTPHGLKDATKDKEVIRAWWQRWPDANVAIRCGIVSDGLVVIDVDGPEGAESLKGKNLVPTICAKTGGGGWHYLYFCPKRLRPKVGILPKVDLRAEDSYIVAPPSIHPSGASYEWSIGPEGMTVGLLPEWVYDLVDAPDTLRPAPPLPDGVVDPAKIGRAALQFVANGAPKGKQRLAAVAAARNFLSAGYTTDAVAHKLWAGFQQCEQDAEEPWTQAEAEKIAKNVATSPPPPLRVMDRPLGPTHTNGRKPISIISATDLMAKNFPPVKFIIPRIWPEGMSLLAAKPKIGKTWLSLGIATSIAFGGVALGTAKVEPGEVLYLALEDGERRIQGRLRAMLLGDAPPADLHFAYSWPRVSEGGIESLAEWIQQHPKTRLIVVDTLRKIRPVERVGASSYNQDYDAISPLTELSHEYNVSIWGVSHLRKQIADDPMEQVSGTMGLTGAADHIFVLKRERTQAQAILYVMSRDIPEEELALEWQPPHWVLVGTAKEAKQSAERKEIADTIKQAGRALAPKDVADLTGRNHSTIKTLMMRMNMDGVLVSDGKGHYDVFPRYAESDETVVSVVPVDRVGSVDRVVPSETTETTETTGITEIIGRTNSDFSETKAINDSVCFCGRPVYTYNDKGEALCDQHCEEGA